MNTKLLYYIFPILILTTSCGGESNDESAETGADTPVTEVNVKYKNVEPSVSAQLSQLVQHYIHLKNALVQSDAAEAKKGAEGIMAAVAAVDTSKLSAEQLNDYKTSAAQVKQHSSSIAASGEIEQQRTTFNDLTSAMYNFVKAFGGGKQLFYQYCPMANDNSGGYWISETEEVNNPYFGDEMLHCGEVKETIR